MKHLIGSRILGYHFAWCSPVLDGASLPWLAPGAAIPPSSNPLDIYRTLKKDVDRLDSHSDAIRRQVESCKAIALKLLADESISSAQAAEIAAIVDAASIADWRPLMFVIPYKLVRRRVQSVPRVSRASVEPEYIVPDLKDHEFQVVEF